MFFRELNRGKCKTYLLGCERTHRAAVVDPLKENTGRYIAVAAYHGFKLDYVIDTHTRADHRSGIWDLAELTGAKAVMERYAPAPPHRYPCYSGRHHRGRRSTSQDTVHSWSYSRRNQHLCGRTGADR